MATLRDIPWQTVDRQPVDQARGGVCPGTSLVEGARTPRRPTRAAARWRRTLRAALGLAVVSAATVALEARAEGRRWFGGARSAASTGTPQRQAPFEPGASPYVTGAHERPKYFVPPTLPRTPTSQVYGTPPGVAPGDWPRYAPFGFGGYRFPAVGAQAYR